MSHAKILILDFGSQYTQAYCTPCVSECLLQLHPYDVDADFIREFKPQGIILSVGLIL